LLLRKADVLTDPFPHTVIKNALEPKYYETLVKTRPTPNQILRGRSGVNQRFDMPTRDALAYWKDFCEYHTSQSFLDDVFKLFGGPKGKAGIRTNGVGMECQPGINTPSPVLSRVRGVHLDNPRELYAGMLYMGEGEGGDLTLCRWNDKPRKYYGKLEVEDECVDVVKTVKYEPNTFVFFMNGPNSLHGVTERKSDNYRLLVNVMCDLDKPLFTVGYGKY
jgi:hypothetical protein